MVRSRREKGARSARTEGARRATGVSADGAAVGSGALAPGQRWSASRGAGFKECYAIDPVAGAEMEVSVNLPDFTTQDIQDIYGYRKVDFEVCVRALEPLIESYVEISRQREIWRVVGEAVDYARENCGANPGEPMTEEQRVRFRDLVLERLTPFLLH